VETKSHKYYASLFQAKKICKTEDCPRCNLAIQIAMKHNRLVLIEQTDYIDKKGNVYRSEYHAQLETI